MSPLVSDSHRRELFPVTREWVYLNHSWRGPVCAPSAKEARDYIDQLSRDGVEPFEQWRERYFEERARFAVFIGAEPGEIAFTANATDAFARVTLGLDWAPGDHVVAPAADYPGVTRPLLDLRRRGVEVTLVPPREDGSMPAEDLLAATTVRTRLVAASHVDFRTGYRLDVKALCSGCRARGVLSLIDAVQSVGCLDLDVKTIGCDFATFAARKWLLGLDTLGLLYVSSARLNDLTPHVLGTYSVERPLDFDDFEQPLAEDARRFQPGLVPAAQIFALGAAVKLQERFGKRQIEARVLELAGEIRRRANEAGLDCVGDEWPGEGRSGIVAIKRSGALAADDLPERLRQAKVSAAVRGGILRVAPHFYNSEKDIERLFAAL